MTRFPKWWDWEVTHCDVTFDLILQGYFPNLTTHKIEFCQGVLDTEYCQQSIGGTDKSKSYRPGTLEVSFSLILRCCNEIYRQNKLSNVRISRFHLFRLNFVRQPIPWDRSQNLRHETFIESLLLKPYRPRCEKMVWAGTSELYNSTLPTNVLDPMILGCQIGR